ncbi:MAG: thiol reductase thioredoxin [Candidatus Aenigmarchaeota archaeon]|nr:thiol reductase thioredoxin [Candidatus Aenigmarchaeota archaeon]
MLKVLFFYKKDDGPSKIQKELLRNIEYILKKKVEVEKIDMDENKRTVEKYGIKEVPSIVVEKDGRVTDKFSGLTQDLFLKRALERNM